jgi:hypothetical protein
MSLQAQTFGAFTPLMFAAFAAKIKTDTGVDIEGNSGTVEHGSFTFKYDYNQSAQLLHIQCLKKPLFIPASTIINGIAEEVAALKAIQATGQPANWA